MGIKGECEKEGKKGKVQANYIVDKVKEKERVMDRKKEKSLSKVRARTTEPTIKPSELFKKRNVHAADFCLCSYYFCSYLSMIFFNKFCLYFPKYLTTHPYKTKIMVGVLVVSVLLSV